MNSIQRLRIFLSTVLIGLSLLAGLAHASDDDIDVSDFDSQPSKSNVQSPQDARTAADISSELKSLKEAINSKDEGAVVTAATHVLGVDSKNLNALNALAVHYYNQGKLGLSKILLLRALADHPDSPALHNNMGMIYMSEGKQSQAITSFRKASELRPGYVPSAGNLGSIYVEYRDFKKAAQVLEPAYASGRSDMRHGNPAIEIANNYAVALSGAGDLDKAKDVFQKIMKADDSNVSALYNYAVLLIARMKNKKEGEKILARLKFLADSSMQKRVDDLEKMLTGT